ncbi:MAG: Rieske (2Fe-2S) protein [Bacteroidetes bacterium]|nr:Rieske (2Fe-2S) protein [Bacteroidota bacterium]
MERKTFIRFLGASVATGSLIAFLDACQKNNPAPVSPSVDFTVDLSASANAALQNSGGSLVNNQVIIINNNGTYVALSDVCTHQGCSVGYDSASKQLNCPCHGASFNLSGAVLGGPAPSSLKQYSVSKNGSTLHITG